MKRITLKTGCVLGAVLASSIGCVERRMTIRSVPSNALVVLDGQEIGHTPVSTSFTYYGDRQVKLIKDGYETKTINQTISTPWYQYFPIDFFSEVIYPFRIRDERNYVYSLESGTMVPTDQLLQRAEELRVQGQSPPEIALQRAKVDESQMGRPEATAQKPKETTSSE